jgi:hypothetical protein
MLGKQSTGLGSAVRSSSLWVPLSASLSFPGLTRGHADGSGGAMRTSSNAVSGRSRAASSRAVTSASRPSSRTGTSPGSRLGAGCLTSPPTGPSSAESGRRRPCSRPSPTGCKRTHRNRMDRTAHKTKEAGRIPLPFVLRGLTDTNRHERRTSSSRRASDGRGSLHPSPVYVARGTIDGNGSLNVPP